MFGPGDSFLHTILALLRKIPVLPMFGRGLTRLQPVYAGDVAQAIARVLERTERRASRSSWAGLILTHTRSCSGRSRALEANCRGFGGIGKGRAEDQVASARIQAERPPSPKLS